jgi:hypothetical protein
MTLSSVCGWLAPAAFARQFERLIVRDLVAGGVMPPIRYRLVTNT